MVGYGEKIIRLLSVMLLVGIGASTVCVPSAEAARKDKDEAAAPPLLVSLDVDHRALGLVFRDLSAQTDAGLVLMNGLENIPVKAFTVEEETLPEVLLKLGKLIGLLVHVTKHYSFMYDPAYEALVTLDLSDRIPDQYDEDLIFASFGSDTPLFTVLALMGHSTGRTLIADNAVADSLCGELNLKGVPLTQAIEAVLQSARVLESGVRIRATDQYVFLHAAEHRLRKNVDSNEIPKKMRRLLQETCSISLLVYSETDGEIRSQLGASRLHKVLSELSLQLGLRVQAERALEHFPVNPMVMNNVTRETALKLFIHQWLVPGFEFTIENETVLIREAK
jgi:hypothetical protein